LKRRY